MTWLHVPASCLSAPASEGSTSACDSPAEPALWVTSSGTPSLRPCSWRGWRTRPWLRLLYGTISQPSTPARGAAEWIWSLPVFHASRSASRASDAGSPTNAGSGPPCFASLTTPQLPLFSSRTSADSPDTGSAAFSRTLPRAGSLRNGIIFERPTSAHRTAASGSSCWPTPTQPYGTNRGGAAGRVGPVRPSLETLAKSWPTAQALDAKGQRGRHTRSGMDLAQESQAWASPSARDWRDTPGMATTRPDRPGQGRLDQLARQAHHWPTPTASDANGSGSRNTPGSKAHAGVSLSDAVQTGDSAGRRQETTPTAGASGSPTAVLSPLFVEAILGLATGWTDFAPLETQSFHSRQPSRTECCAGGS